MFVELFMLLCTTEGGGGRICEGLTALVSIRSLDNSLVFLMGEVGSLIWEGTTCRGGGLSEDSRLTGGCRGLENIEAGG